MRIARSDGGGLVLIAHRTIAIVMLALPEIEVHQPGTPEVFSPWKACIARRFRQMSESPTLSASRDINCGRLRSADRGSNEAGIWLIVDGDQYVRRLDQGRKGRSFHEAQFLVRITGDDDRQHTSTGQLHFDFAVDRARHDLSHRTA